MYEPFYNTGVPPMWLSMPPGYSPMPAPGPFGMQNNQGFDFLPMQNMPDMPFPGYAPPPPPDFSGFYPGF